MRLSAYNLAIIILSSVWIILPMDTIKGEDSSSIDKNTSQQIRNDLKPYNIVQQSPEEDMYGSIAVHGYGSAYGFALDRTTREEAVDAAIQYCFEYSRGTCETALVFKNACAALATRFNGYGVGYASNIQTAQQNALNYCNNQYCKIKEVVCTKNIIPE